MKRIISVLMCIFFLSIPVQGKTQKEAVDAGIKWLKATQMADGSFMQYPAVTALCVSSMIRNGVSANDPSVVKGVEFILKCVQPDGSIAVDKMGCYNTSICIMALADTKDPKHAKTIEKAREWLKKTQVGNLDRVESSDKFYGGIGYDSKMKPDLSNLQHAIEALAASSCSENMYLASESVKKTDAEAFERAIFFLSRCQNKQGTNDQKWAGTDGGFIYSPDGESKAKGTISYGSMTYAGLKSFIYCNVERTDSRVVAAYDWIKNNYNLNENPKMGAQGLYYYYHTFAKALNLMGDKSIKDGTGKEHLWAKELSEKVISLQKPEGFWANDADRWWESKKELATAYGLLTLSYCAE
ncbi:MAG: terpene cyclase/mutase family protein [Candidatus Firestonebacteria bacterium]|nr:terpene cyclase/mutase family protein [Candidatus Firestonebacteria bacterium]